MFHFISAASCSIEPALTALIFIFNSLPYLATLSLVQDKIVSEDYLVTKIQLEYRKEKFITCVEISSEANKGLV